MVIQIEKIWLFETEVSDPYNFDKVDGVEVVLRDDRTLESLSVDRAVYYISTISKSGLTYSKEYGGEDNESFNSDGKTRTTYNLSFNLPVLFRTIRSISPVFNSLFC